MQNRLLLNLVLIGLFLNVNILAKNIPDLAEELLPTVVNIYSNSKLSVQEGSVGEGDGNSDEFNLPITSEYNYSNPEATSLGSGVIIDKDGHILTNYHVIAEANEVMVKNNLNKEFAAKIIGFDASSDLALIKIKPYKEMVFAKMDDSSKFRIGDNVVAIGNAFGFGSTVTSGIISYKNRNIGSNGFNNTIKDFIQTDARMSQGFSGGPLFNMKGEIIGINTAIYSNSGHSNGAAFAIPSGTAILVAEQLKRYGEVRRSHLNLIPQDITPTIAAGLDIKNQSGVLVVSVDQGGAAYKAGIKAKDIIISFNNESINSSDDLRRALMKTAIGSKSIVKVIRNNKEQEFTIYTEKMPNYTVSRKKMTEVQGVELHNISDDIKKIFAIKDNVSGVVVVRVAYNSPWKNKISKGDVIQEINMTQIKNIDELIAEYNKAKKIGKDNITVLASKESHSLFIALPIK